MKILSDCFRGPLKILWRATFGLGPLFAHPCFRS